MDLRQARSYINWKTGVELKLYQFQFKQSNKGIKGPSTSAPLLATTQEKIQDLGEIMPDANAWELLGLDMPSGDEPLESVGMCPNKLELESDTMPQSTIVKPINKPMQPAMVPIPSKAKIFMESRPGGMLEKQEQEMKVVERRISSPI